MKDRPDPASHGTELRRDLKLFDITMIGVGAMIGAGIFVLTGIAAGAAGPGLALAFLLNGVVTIFTAMTYAELGSAIPEAGGGYLWVKEALGKSNGFLAGWMSWFSHAVAGSLYALGFGAYFNLMLNEFNISLFGIPGPIMEKLLAVAVALLFIYINFRGASETGMAGNIVTIAKLVTIGLFIVFGLIAMAKDPNVLANFSPFLPNGLGSVFVAMGLTFIAFEGYEIIVQAGEEVEDPKRNIPKAVFMSLAIVVPIYVLVAITSIGAITVPGTTTWEFLGAHKELGLVEVARKFMPLGTMILLVGGLLSTISALNATTYSSTRVSFAMGRDRVLPQVFAKVHPLTKTPYIALLATGALIITMVIAVPIEDVAAAADVMFLLLFLQVNYAIIIIRREFGDRLDYGYKIRLFPLVPIIAIITNTGLALFLFRSHPRGWISALAWIMAGLFIFFVYAKDRLEEAEKPEIAYEVKIGERAPESVLVPIADPSHLKTEMTIGSAMARAIGAEVVALNVVRIPPQLPLSQGRQYVAQARPILDAAVDFGSEKGVPVHTILGIGHRISQVIRDIAKDEASRLIVMGWKGQVHEGKIRGSVAEAVLSTSSANVAMVKDHGLPEEFTRIMVAVSPGLRSEITLKTAARLAKGLDCDLQITTVQTSQPADKDFHIEDWLRETKEAVVAHGLAADRVTTKILKSDSVVQAIVEEAANNDLLVIGASRDWVVKTYLFGSLPDSIANQTPVSTVLVKEAEAPVLSIWRRLIGAIR